jgi:hypothetical protein
MPSSCVNAAHEIGHIFGLWHSGDHNPPEPPSSSWAGPGRPSWLLRGEVLEAEERVLARKNIDGQQVWTKK